MRERAPAAAPHCVLHLAPTPSPPHTTHTTHPQAPLSHTRAAAAAAVEVAQAAAAVAAAATAADGWQQTTCHTRWWQRGAMAMWMRHRHHAPVLPAAQAHHHHMQLHQQQHRQRRLHGVPPRHLAGRPGVPVAVAVAVGQLPLQRAVLAAVDPVPAAGTWILRAS